MLFQNCTSSTPTKQDLVTSQGLFLKFPKSSSSLLYIWESLPPKTQPGETTALKYFSHYPKKSEELLGKLRKETVQQSNQTEKAILHFICNLFICNLIRIPTSQMRTAWRLEVPQTKETFHNVLKKLIPIRM